MGFGLKKPFFNSLFRSLNENNPKPTENLFINMSNLNELESGKSCANLVFQRQYNKNVINSPQIV